MNFTVFKDWSELPQSSDKLFNEAEKDSVFFSREWFQSLTPHIVTSEQQLLLACVIDDDLVLAILPILTNENRAWRSFTHPYSSLFSILLTADKQTKTLNCLCKGLKELPFDYLTLAPIADDDVKLDKFQQAMVAKDVSCYQNHKAHNWFHRIENQKSFADYLAERPSKVRNTLIRKQRKLKCEHDYDIQLYGNKNTDKDIQQALAIYHGIYKVSWKANEQHEYLVNDVVKRFAKRAWPRLAILKVDNKPIAAQLWFVVEGKASIFRLVYDESWKTYSPGSILMSYLLEYVIDTDKVEEIDFLSGNDGYKKDWMSERRERKSLVCVNEKTKENTNSDNLFDQFKKLLFK